MAERRKLLSLALLALAAAIATAAAAQEKPADPALTLERIFAGREFAPERFGPARWMTDGATYTTLEPSAEAKDGRDLVLWMKRATCPHEPALSPSFTRRELGNPGRRIGQDAPCVTQTNRGDDTERKGQSCWHDGGRLDWLAAYF